MVRGSTPAAAEATIRAQGFNPRAAAASSLIKTSAAAPSLIPEALPAVTVPLDRKAGLSFASASLEESRRGLSSVSTSMGSPFRCGTGTGTISSANFPESMAAMARW